MNAQPSLLRTTYKTSLVLGVRVAVLAGTLLLLARSFGSTGFGAFTGVASVAILLGTLSSLGINTFLLTEVAQNKNERNKILTYAVPATLLAGSLLLCIYVGINRFGFSSEIISFNSLLCIGLTEIFFAPLLTLVSSEHQALKGVAKSQLVLVTPLLLRFFSAFFVFLYSTETPIDDYAWYYLLSSVTALIVGLFSLSEPWPNPKNWQFPSIKQLRKSSRYAFMNFVALGPFELDKAVALKVLPEPQAGVYSISSRIVYAALAPLVALLLTLQPKVLQDLLVQPERVKASLTKTLLVAVFFGGVLGGGLWFFSDMFNWVLGGSYTGVSASLKHLSLITPAMALKITVCYLFVALKMPLKRSIVEIAGLVVFFITIILWTPAKSASGFIHALIVAEYFATILGVILMLKFSKVS